MNTEFKKLSYFERQQMNYEELIVYFETLREYYLSLDFDKKQQLQSEKRCQMLFGLLNPIFKNYYKPIIIDKNKVPENSGLIFVPNHTHPYDPILVMMDLKIKHMHLLAKSEIKEMKERKLFEAIGSVFVDRSDAESKREAKDELIKILLHEGNVMIFPESTINKSEENILPFQNGACSIAQITGRPIIPVSIYGKYEKKQSPIIIYSNPFYVKPDDNVYEMTKKLEEVVSENIDYIKNEENIRRLKKQF